MHLAIILILAIFVRIYNLGFLPLNHDEANWIIPSVERFDKFLGIPVSSFKGNIRPFLSYLVYFSRKFFTSPEYSVRIPAVIIGVATVALIYLLVKEMYGKKAGLISAMLLSFLPWHVIQSRDGREMITTPFFGCLIALALLKSVQKKSHIWFMLFWVFLGIGAFYTYAPSVLFVPIFLVSLFLLKKDFTWIKPRDFLLGIVIFFIIIYPLIYLQIMGQIPLFLEKFYWYYYKDGAFTSNDNLWTFLTQSVQNIKNNNPLAFETLFLQSRGRMLYAATLESPLLITKLSLFIVLASIVLSLWRKKASDRILLIWLILGYLGVISTIRFFLTRHIIIILIPLLILISRSIAEMFSYAIKNNTFKRRLFVSVGFLFCAGLVFIGLPQLFHYYRNAPYDLEECRRNSYGCKEVAQYLSQVQDMKDVRINTDFRMTALAYLKYLQSLSQHDIENIKHGINKRVVYYIIWAPESHPENYWGGAFLRLRRYFRDKYPQEKPIKTIYYPNGMAAIHIFKVANEM